MIIVTGVLGPWRSICSHGALNVTVNTTASESDSDPNLKCGRTGNIFKFEFGMIVSAA